MSAIIIKLFGRKATYTSSTFASDDVHTYGQIDDDMLRAFAAQQSGGQSADYDITRPDAA